MQPWHQESPPRILRFRDDSKILDLEVQRSRSCLVVRGRYECPGELPLATEVVLRSKERDALAVTSLASDGSFVIETFWSRKRTVLLQVGDFYVPVVRALDRSRLLGSKTTMARSARRGFSS